MTLIHGTKQESEQAAWFRCCTEDGGPVHELKKELAAVGGELKTMQTAFIELRTTCWTGVKAGVALLSLLTLTVAVLAYLSTARSAPSGFVPHAHAETKGSTP